MFLRWLVVVLCCSSASCSDWSELHCVTGRTTLVQLFEWRWADVARECEDFLGPKGFCGVQISPPSENAVVTGRPWTERYQPISYKLSTRSGNETQFQDMVERCNNVNVRIYADVAINNMASGAGKGTGTGGTSWDGTLNDFPGVPFGNSDVNTACTSTIQSNYDAQGVRKCRLDGKVDLHQGKDYVRDKIAEYLNKLLGIGVAGFRVDATRNMWPGDLTAIFGRLQNLNSTVFGSGKKPFLYQDIRDDQTVGDGEYLTTGRITKYLYGVKLNEVFRKQNALKWLETFGKSWGIGESTDVVVFISNHDSQRNDGNVLTYKDSRLYKMATAFMLAWPHGVPIITSSYNFTEVNQGPPSTNEEIDPVTITPDGRCAGGWVCEHRWPQVYSMVAFRNIAGSEPVENWTVTSEYQVSFSRGNKTFIAINLESFDFKATVQTGLSAGWYCDVMSGYLGNDGKCTGTTVKVRHDGTADISICGRNQNPVVAIHTGQQIGSAVRTLG
ncbi:alpha-amylase-like [Littorina saxatilis]|uniref:alpha-amylase n=1 Tax=Littorina saxatilis TaxID=31220 RepID=A0AAN9G1U5_9CAEN